MIINQTIKDGFTTINKTGAYFSLISAGGLVRVKLTKSGRTVLDSDMWVGMSIPQALPFDEINIFGADGRVEFWAGDVSISNSITTNGAAKAIRTSKHLVSGSVAITGADLARTGVRVRTNKDILLGGAGVTGLGWELKAGSTENIPIAGILSAYKEPAQLDITNSQYLETGADLFPSNAKAASSFISDDESTMLTWSNNTFPKLWTVETGLWVDHPSFAGYALAAGSLIKSELTGKVYMVRMTGLTGTHSYGYCQYTIFESSDDGRTFKQVDFIDVNTKVSQGLINNSMVTLVLALNGYALSINQSGVAIKYNLITRKWSAIGAGSLPVNFLSSGFSQVYFFDDSDRVVYLSNRDWRLRQSDDGGVTWSFLTNNEFSAIKFNDGVNMAGVEKHSSKNIVLSNDSGRSWVAFEQWSGDWAEDSPTYFSNGLWIVGEGQYITSMWINQDGEKQVLRATQTNAMASSQDGVMLTNSGKMYRFSTTSTLDFVDIDKWQLDVTGDLKPAIVEVMELLS